MRKASIGSYILIIGRFLELFGKYWEVWFFEVVCHWGPWGLDQRFQKPSPFPVSSASLLLEDIRSQLLLQHYACLIFCYASRHDSYRL